MKKIFLLLVFAAALPQIFFSCNSGNDAGKKAGADSSKTDSAKKISLGGAEVIGIGSADLQKSVAYWQKLGFKKTNGNLESAERIEMSDESLVILLIHSEKPFLRISYFDAKANEIADAVEKAGNKFTIKNDNSMGVPRSIFYAADSVMVGLIASEASAVYCCKGKNLKTMTPKEQKDGAAYPNKKCGVFGEFSVPVKDLDASMKYWSQFGFTSDGKYSNPYPWCIMNDGKMVLGLHQQTHFNYRALTYFAPDMKKRIEQLKKEGIVFTGSGQGDDNLVTVSPEGVHLFLFEL